MQFVLKLDPIAWIGFAVRLSVLASQTRNRNGMLAPMWTTTRSQFFFSQPLSEL